MLEFTGERIVPGAANCEPTFARKMYQEHVARYAFAAHLTKGKTVLDIGCGVGYGARWLASNGAASVTAFDVAADAIEHARTNYSHPNVEFVVGDATSFQPTHKVDVVSCFELIEHVVDQEAVLRNAVAALKPDGLLIISTPRPLEQERTHFHEHELDLEEFQALLKRYFKNASYFYERNYFTSLVYKGTPNTIDDIIPITDKFGISEADYFVFIASNADIDNISYPTSVLVINDDNYILNLEKDVNILHSAEDNLKNRLAEAHSRIEAVEGDNSQLNEARKALESAQSEKSAHLDRIRKLEETSSIASAQIEVFRAHALTSDKQIAASMMREQRLTQELLTARGALKDVEDQLASLNHRLGVVELEGQTRTEALVAELKHSQDEAEQRVAVAMRRAVKIAGDVHLSELRAEEAEKKLREVERGAIEKVSELQTLRSAFATMEERANESERRRESAEANLHLLLLRSQSLERVRASLSWRLTRPVRWLEKRFRPTTKLDSSSVQALVRSHMNPQHAPSGQAAAAPSAEEPDRAGPKVVDVLFIIGCWEGESKRYRVYNLIEGIEALGYTSMAIDAGQMQRIIEDGDIQPKVAVFFRTPFDPKHGVVSVLERFRQHGVRTIFDIDDLVFEPEIIPQIAGVQTMNEDQMGEYEWGVRAYRTMMFSCDRATASTSPLVDRINQFGRLAYVVRNTLNAAQIERATQLLAHPKRDDGKIRICYFSGSATHLRDFNQAAEGIRTAMRKDPRLILRIAGILDLDDAWSPFAERIERQPFMPPLDMLNSLNECDINLAPLEEGNAFCEGKSELKYFEAALVETATIASRTAPFAAAIENGINGRLASLESEWAQAILDLAADPKLRQRMAAAARAHAIVEFGTERAAKDAVTAYGLDQWTTPVLKNGGLKIGWIVPGLIIGGGGHRNILRAAYHLERFGHDVRLYFSDTNMSSIELRRAVREHFYAFNGPVSRFEGHADGEDVMMATHWSTVALAEAVKDSIGEIMYFVQDFEPAFYPIGSEYLMAENTYRKKLYAICSGPWCEHLLKRDYEMEADHFRFPVDNEIYYPRPHLKKENRILFFAKPDMPRRCFLIGISALREVHRLRPDIEVMFFGSEAARSHPLDFPVTFSGVLPTIHDLADRYATSMVGMVFSTTNPSLVPYEMMACGLPVVDLGRPGNEVNYDSRDDLALLADPEPTIMARQIIAMIDKPGELEARAERGLAFAQSFPTEDEMARRVESLIVERNKLKSKKARPVKAQ